MSCFWCTKDAREDYSFCDKCNKLFTHNRLLIETTKENIGIKPMMSRPEPIYPTGRFVAVPRVIIDKLKLQYMLSYEDIVIIDKGDFEDVVGFISVEFANRLKDKEIDLKDSIEPGVTESLALFTKTVEKMFKEKDE